jgi:hypothetical protein
MNYMIIDNYFAYVQFNLTEHIYGAIKLKYTLIIK